MITIKAHFGEDIRRFSIEEDITFQKLESLLKEIFELENIDIKYIDDDADLITMSSDLDLKEAKLMLKNPKILRLVVVLSNKTQDSHLNKNSSTIDTSNANTIEDIINVDILKDIATIPQTKDLPSELKDMPKEKLVDICCSISEAISSQSFSSSDEIMNICLDICSQIVKETDDASRQTLDMCKNLNRDYSNLSDEVKNQCNDLSNSIRTLCLSTSEEIANMIRNI